MLALRILLSKNGLTFFLCSIAGWVVASILPPLGVECVCRDASDVSLVSGMAVVPR